MFLKSTLKLTTKTTSNRKLPGSITFLLKSVGKIDIYHFLNRTLPGKLSKSDRLSLELPGFGVSQSASFCDMGSTPAHLRSPIRAIAPVLFYPQIRSSGPFLALIKSSQDLLYISKKQIFQNGSSTHFVQNICLRMHNNVKSCFLSWKLHRFFWPFLILEFLSVKLHGKWAIPLNGYHQRSRKWYHVRLSLPCRLCLV